MHPDDSTLPSDAQMTAMMTFSSAVLTALNAAKIHPGAVHCALLAIVAGENPEDPPVGGAFNFDRDTLVWKFDVELLLSQPVDGSDG